jgi:hypothetical protein
MLTRFEECLGVLDTNFMCQTFVSDMWSMVCSIIKAMGHGVEMGMCGDLSKYQTFLLL